MKRESERLNTFVQEIKNYKAKILTLEFEESNKFFKSLLNNFEFLIIFYDSEILFEDFIKLPGGKA